MKNFFYKAKPINFYGFIPLGVVLENRSGFIFIHHNPVEDDLLIKIVSKEPPSLATQSKDAPEWLVEIVAKALSRDPDARFASAGEMADAIRKRSA